MPNDSNIVFHEAHKKGRGLPFAIVEHEELVSSSDLFTPSLRDFHVIFWFKKGTGSYYVDFKKHIFKPNTIVLLAKDQVSYFEPFKDQDTQLQSITFNPSYIYRSDGDLAHLYNFAVNSHLDGMQVLELKEKDTSFLQMLSQHMRDVFTNWDHKGRQQVFYHWLSLFLIHCERLQQRLTSTTPVDEKLKLLQGFNQLLEQHFREEFKLDFYVERLNITLKSLAKLTKERYKMTPKSVIDERRVLELKRLLKGTSKSSKEIAYMLNFDEPTNMVKYFKKHTGITPLAFRESQ